jgi:hypothetical protein
MSMLEKDSAYFQEGMESLEAYLLSSELFWPLKANQPRLTVGGMLLASQRLRARLSSAEWGSRAEQLDRVRLKWRSAWERKAGREVHARLDLWRNFLDDVRQSEPGAGMYPQQVEYRVMLQLLRNELTVPVPDLEAVDALDRLLHTLWLPGAFVWDADLSGVFPEPEFWFLYGRLK